MQCAKEKSRATSAKLTHTIPALNAQTQEDFRKMGLMMNGPTFKERISGNHHESMCEVSESNFHGSVSKQQISRMKSRNYRLSVLTSNLTRGFCGPSGPSCPPDVAHN